MRSSCLFGAAAAGGIVLVLMAGATAAAGKAGNAEPEYGKRGKRYPGARRVELPAPDFKGRSLEAALKERRTVRHFAETGLRLAELSQLLFAASGKTNNWGGRTAPSAGALYPLEVYVLVNRVDRVRPGIYHYLVAEHTLELVKEGKFGEAGSRASLGQSQIGDSAATFVLSAVPERCAKKYGKRCSRYIPIEAGHVSQNIYLQAVSLGLVSGVVGAFDDEAWGGLIGLADARAPSDESYEGVGGVPGAVPGVEGDIPGYGAIVGGNLKYRKAAEGERPREWVIYLHAVGRPEEKTR